MLNRERTFSESKQTFLEKLDCRRHVPEEEEQSKTNFQALLNLLGWQINQHRWDWTETLDTMSNMSRNWKLYIKRDERSKEHKWLIKVGRGNGELQRAKTVTTKWKSRRHQPSTLQSSDENRYRRDGFDMGHLEMYWQPTKIAQI